MSYHEAIEDGIPIETRKQGHFTRYYPPCGICGAPVCSWSYLRNVRYVCGECRKILIALDRQERVNDDGEKKAKKLNEAIRRISKMTSVKPYDSAILWVSEHLDRPGWFQSTEEIMVALELIRRGVKAHHQAEVQGYKVDFLLPDLKVALEIDGIIYHGKDRAPKEQIRDDVICYNLGAGWEVVRILTDNININVTKLLPAIKAVVARRKKNAGGGTRCQ